jgi:hypothetical protein
MKSFCLSLTLIVPFSVFAATVTPQVLVTFDGSISGNTYTLGTGEVDTTGTFTGVGSPVVSGGEADLNQNGGLAVQQGFEFNPGSIGTLTTTNWVAEALVSFDALLGISTVISVQGDTDFRIVNAGTSLEAAYWDGSVLGQVFPALPATNTPVHLALVWNAAATSLTAYVDGVSAGTIDNGAFATPDTSYVSFGYFGRSGFEGRAMDGQLDGVAFSTYSGTFDPSADFVIPEPSSMIMVGFFALAAGCVLRRRT